MERVFAVLKRVFQGGYLAQHDGCVDYVLEVAQSEGGAAILLDPEP